MKLRITRERLWTLVGIAIPIAGALILFFSGLFPLENLFLVSPQNLTASVAPADVASLTNQARLASGEPPLAVSPLLTEAAQLKADDMAKNSYYSHTGPDGKTMLDWLHVVGYNYLNSGENLVIDRTTAPEVVDAWMNSPDHRANILRPQFTQFGVGVAEGEYQGIHTIFVVQEFGTPYPSTVHIATSQNVPAVKAKAVTVSAAPKLSVPSVPAPVSITHVALLSTPNKTLGVSASSPAVTGTSTNAVTVNTASSSQQGTTTLSYTLAPEFYAPVTLTSRQNLEAAAQKVAPKASSASLFSVWISNIKQYLSHIL